MWKGVLKMMQYQGKRINVFSVNGERVSGVCMGATDDIVKIKVEDEPDVRAVFIRNIYYYTVDGLGDDDGVSGLRLFMCRNPGVCPGIKKLSIRDINIGDMGCEASDKKGCDFGCIGSLERIPSRVLRPLLSGMEKRERIGEKNG